MTRKQPRDSYRSKVYAAERAVWPIGSRRQMMELDEIEQMVAKLRSSAWYRRRYPTQARLSFTVKDGRGRRAAGGGAKVITLPRWSRWTTVVLHELAHSIVQAEWIYDRPENVVDYAVHGRRWVQVYLELVHHVEGPQAAAELKESFKAYKVPTALKRKTKPMTPERRAQLSDQLAAARKANS